ncbi:MAG: hypothetical protein Q9167_001960 [Letrouitia subvulpina]
MRALASYSAAHDFLTFINASPTPFHVVELAKQRLVNAGFQQIKERDSWEASCKPGGKYFLTRNTSTIVAFAVGKKWQVRSLLANEAAIPLMTSTTAVR